MSYTPLRTQYAFDLSGVKCKSQSDLISFQRQWATFERVENYDDIVFQKLMVGNRGTLFYQFNGRQEATDYKNGQTAHIKRYPWLPPTTFDSIRLRALPTTAMTVPPPNEAGPSKICGPFSPTQTSSERLVRAADLTTYVHVSTFNAVHVYKYAFVSDEEKMSYHRAERQILSP